MGSVRGTARSPGRSPARRSSSRCSSRTNNDPQSYTLNATGTILVNGEITARYVERQLRPCRPDGDLPTSLMLASEVFSFTTTPTCVDVMAGVTKFGYNIPAGAPIVDGFALSGKAVAVKVTDGGSSGAPYDKYEHNFAAGGSCLVPGR